MSLPDPSIALQGFDREQRYTAGFTAVHAFRADGLTIVNRLETAADPRAHRELSPPESVLEETILALDPFSDWNREADPGMGGWDTEMEG